MKELEFRMWHVADKRYYEIYSMAPCGRGWKIEYVKRRIYGMPDIGTLYELESPYGPADRDYVVPFVLEQYVGLLDSKNKKIFENDILNIIGNTVTFVKGEYVVAGDLPVSYLNTNMEVIGNIHEVKA